MIKKLWIILSILLLSSFLACNLANNNDLTSVRVISLSYLYSDKILTSNNVRIKSSRLLGTRNELEDTMEYIFPDDVLTFTIEIEDPNYEFVSLLSIKFNDQVIRANVDNSITSTRDCGNNICIDFPIKITKEVTNYEVQEVKFAKLNTDVGVSAIIDNSTERVVVIDVFQGDIYPYVSISVDNLNEMIDNVNFYIENDDYTLEMWEALVFDVANRVMVIDYFNKDFPYQDCVFCDDTDIFRTNMGGRGQDVSVISVGAQISNEITFFSPHLHFYMLDIIYKDTYFYNVGNLIYVNILGNSYFLIEMDKRTLIRPLEASDIVPLE